MRFLYINLFSIFVLDFAYSYDIKFTIINNTSEDIRLCTEVLCKYIVPNQSLRKMIPKGESESVVLFVDLDSFDVGTLNKIVILSAKNDVPIVDVCIEAPHGSALLSAIAKDAIGKSNSFIQSSSRAFQFRQDYGAKTKWKNTVTIND